MKKLPPTPEELAVKTCKRGHTGEYVLVKERYSACKACIRASVARHRGVEVARLERQVELSQKRLAELELLIPKLKKDLALAETEYDFVSKKLAILGVTK